MGVAVHSEGCDLCVIAYGAIEHEFCYLIPDLAS